MRVEEVFVAGGFPVHTYNPRNQLELEKKFTEYLKTGFKLLSLTGPTKSGKTVLCRNLIKKGESIWISGGDIRQEIDFWMEILTQLKLPTTIITEHREEKGEAISSEVAAGINVIAKFGGSVTGTETAQEGYARTLSRTDNPRTVAISALSEYDKPIIIDDFHYIPPQIQINIIRSLKTPIFEGLRLVLLSVPHRAYEADKIETEMTGRVQQLKIPLWGELELIEIAKRGFPLLNIKCSDEVNKIMASESFGNPQLMQEFCKYLCYSNNVQETIITPLNITKILNKELFFSQIADTIASKSDFERLMRGPRPRADRKKRDFADGRQGDIYLAILIALANTGPKVEAHYEGELRSKLRSVLKGDLPPFQQVSRVLGKMQDITSYSKGKPRVLEWDSSSTTLHILDPYFAFFLRWAIKNHTQQEHLTGTDF